MLSCACMSAFKRKVHTNKTASHFKQCVTSKQFSGKTTFSHLYIHCAFSASDYVILVA